MSQAAALELVGKYYAAFNAGDGEGMLACLAETIAHDVNQGARQVGKDAFRAFLAHMDRSYAEKLADIVVMANEDGSRAAAEFVVHGEYLTTDEGLPEAKGQKYILPAGAFFDIENGLIARVTVYYNLEDWIRQVSV
ncbi:MAG: nuclear transport factor 2 family protein [Novosphingobium sp.]|nr:nuclear transport factor 2 family protein [Novosphingobium sp.]MBO9601009.1 nuclear transport factor 2 family protein [Novosphingobium sp.]